MHHVTQGFTTDELAVARLVGYRRYLEHQLDPDGIDDSALDAELAQRFPSLAMTGKEIFDAYVAVGQRTEAAAQLKGAAIVRSVRSKRQLLERMCELWTDHFSMDHNDTYVLWLKTVDDREVIRRHALGKFPDLLRASAHSGAMMWYLDNYANVQGAPQENWARELMELHSLGVTGPYTETDVVEVARCFTGWTFHLQDSPLHGEFRFDAAAHDPAPKTVLGVPITAGGQADGEAVLDLLAMHPSTARFVARKIASWLLRNEPPEPLVERVAQVYLATGGDIKDMIREVLSLDTLMETLAWRAPKLRRPFHLAVALLRAARSTVPGTEALVQRSSLLGHAPFEWPAPNGYPDTLGAWGSSLLPRWAFAADYLAGAIDGADVDLDLAFAAVGGVDPPRLGAQIDRILTGGTMDPADVAEVQHFVDARPFGPDVTAQAFALAASMPSYQFV